MGQLAKNSINRFGDMDSQFPDLAALKPGEVNPGYSPISKNPIPQDPTAFGNAGRFNSNGQLSNVAKTEIGLGAANIGVMAGLGIADAIGGTRDRAASAEANAMYAEQERLNLAEKKRQADIANDFSNRQLALQKAQATFAERFQSWENDFADELEKQNAYAERADKISGKTLTREDAIRISQFNKRLSGGK